MTKTWDTKKKILDLLSKKRMTLTDISKELNLAPSTVNQHIKELLSADAITQVDNPYVVKWKYYEINPSFRGIEAMKAPRMALSTPFLNVSNPTFKIIPILIAIAVVAAFIFEFGGGIFGGTASTTAGAFAASIPASATLFSISDAPTTSAVSAVNITVSNATIHSQTTGKWYTILSTPKKFNLVTLRNISAALATANIPAGNYDEIVLEVTNASAVVNNQSTNVFLPSGDLKIFGNFSITSNSLAPSWVNIDINLDKSLHITGEGSVILAPVINLKASSGANLSVATNGIVYVKSPGKPDSDFNASMDLNGTFHVNLISVPEGAHLGVGENGKVLILSNSSITNTIVLRTGHIVIVIANITNVTGIIDNISAKINASIEGNEGNESGGQGNGKIEVNNHFNCTMQDGSVDCDTDHNISVNNTIPIWASAKGYGGIDNHGDT